MKNQQHLSLLLKKAHEEGYSLIETVGEDEARKLYTLAAAYKAEVNLVKN